MAKRVSIELPGMAHDNPLPAACRLGPLLITSGVSGKMPHTGKYPETIEEQCSQMFAAVRQILELGGALPEHVVKVNFWVRDRGLRPYINKEWLELFPDSYSRPARHTFQTQDLPDGMMVQCEVIAYITE